MVEQSKAAYAIFFQRLLIAAALVVFLLLVWYTVDVFLLVFAGIIFAIALRILSGWVTQLLPLSDTWALMVVLLLLVLLVGSGLWLLGPHVSNQFVQLSDTLPQSFDRVQQYLTELGWPSEIFSFVPSVEQLSSTNQMALVSRVTTIFSTTLGAMANVLIVLFIGIYLALDPYLYVNGFLRLLPANRREQTRAVLDEVGHVLRRWLLGRLTAMVIIGILTAAGLWLLDIPLALSLALVAGVLNFIPYIGPLLSAVPAVLLGLLQSPTTALYVALLYLGIQFIESYIVTPLVQQRAVSLPPALTITTQIILSVLVGGLGLLFATPLTAAGLVLVQMLYVEEDPCEARSNEG